LVSSHSPNPYQQSLIDATPTLCIWYIYQPKSSRKKNEIPSKFWNSKKRKKKQGSPIRTPNSTFYSPRSHCSQAAWCLRDEDIRNVQRRRQARQSRHFFLLVVYDIRHTPDPLQPQLYDSFQMRRMPDRLLVRDSLGQQQPHLVAGQPRFLPR